MLFHLDFGHWPQTPLPCQQTSQKTRYGPWDPGEEEASELVGKSARFCRLFPISASSYRVLFGAAFVCGFQETALLAGVCSVVDTLRAGGSRARRAPHLSNAYHSNKTLEMR